MKKYFLAALLLTLQLCSLAQATKQTRHVVIITIDGFRPDFYLDSSWQAPHLRAMLASGTHAKGVNSVFPSMTYPSHTTIITGVWPARHGIYYNNMFEPEGSNYWNAHSIKVPTLWQLAEAKKLKTAALLWPVAAEAPVLYNIPDNGGRGDEDRERYSTPAGLIQELKNNVFDQAARIEYGKDHNVAALAAYIIKKDQPNLMTIHFFSVDHYQHQQGRDGDQVRAAVRDADSSVNIIINALKQAGIWEKTVLIVTGDHGFVDVKSRVNPNVWLAAAGLITDLKKNEWKARFFSVGGSSYLYLKDKKDQATLQAVEKLLADLPEAEREKFRLIDRSQLDRIGGNPEVALALSGEKGASFSNASDGPAIQPGKGGAHGYFPDFKEIQTGFLISGPGIRKGGMIPEMNLRDIAPLVARLLQLPLTTADGKIPAGVLQQ